MSQVLVRNIDSAVLQKLKLRAQNNQRSLEAELRIVLEEAVAESNADAFADVAKVRALFAGRKFSDSAELIRENRER